MTATATAATITTTMTTTATVLDSALLLIRTFNLVRD